MAYFLAIFSSSNTDIGEKVEFSLPSLVMFLVNMPYVPLNPPGEVGGQPRNATHPKSKVVRLKFCNSNALEHGKTNILCSESSLEIDKADILSPKSILELGKADIHSS